MRCFNPLLYRMYRGSKIILFWWWIKEILSCFCLPVKCRLQNPEYKTVGSGVQMKFFVSLKICELVKMNGLLQTGFLNQVTEILNVVIDNLLLIFRPIMYVRKNNSFCIFLKILLHGTKQKSIHQELLFLRLTSIVFKSTINRYLYFQNIQKNTLTSTVLSAIIRLRS